MDRIVGPGELKTDVDFDHAYCSQCQHPAYLHHGGRECDVLDCDCWGRNHDWIIRTTGCKCPDHLKKESKVQNFDGLYEFLAVRPESLWKGLLRENEELVGRLRRHGARVLPNGVLVVEADKVFRVTLLLREHSLTWRFDPAHAVETALAEGDPVTLMNRMLFDPDGPYTWLNRKQIDWFPEGEEIEDALDDYDKSIPDYAKQKLTKPDDAKAATTAAKGLDHGWQDPQLAAVGEGEEKPTDIKSESGTKSTDPSFNPCPAYMKQFCRVDGRACLYNKETFEDCPKFPAAKTMSAKNLAIPPGTEDDENYGVGAFGDKDVSDDK